MSATEEIPITLPNYGQYSDGAIQAHYINDDGVTSTVVRLGPMIAPYAIHGLTVDGYDDGVNTIYTISGVAQIGSNISVYDDPIDPAIETATTDAWGYFTLALQSPNDDSGTDLTGLTLTMTDPVDGTIVSVPLSIEQSRPVGDFLVDDADGYAVEIDGIIPAAGEVNQFTDDGGLTWTDLTDASTIADTEIGPGLYSVGTIRVRAEGGLSTAKSGIIVPYQPRDIRTQRNVDSDWLISGTADIGSEVVLVDVAAPTVPIGAPVTVNEYGEFELVVDAASIDPDTNQYQLMMTNNGLTGYSIDIPFVDGASPPPPPTATYILNGEDVAVEVSDFPVGATVQISFDGGRTWQS